MGRDKVIEKGVREARFTRLNVSPVIELSDKVALAKPRTLGVMGVFGLDICKPTETRAAFDTCSCAELQRAGVSCRRPRNAVATRSMVTNVQSGVWIP